MEDQQLKSAPGAPARVSLVAFEHVDCLPEHDKGFLPALAALLPQAKASPRSAE